MTERDIAKAKWELERTSNYLDERGVSHPNPHYIKKELIDGVVIETMPNKLIIDPRDKKD